jgi:hypothetical protein
VPNPILLGVPAALVLALAGSFFRERSLRRLNVTEAGTLVLAIRPIRVRFTLALVGIFLIWLLLFYALPSQRTTLFLLVLPCLLICVAIAQWIGWRTLRKCALPPEFFRNYRAASVLTFLAYTAFLGGLVATAFFRARG